MKGLLLLSALTVAGALAGPRSKAQMPSQAEGPGAQMFQRCYSCHSLKSGETGLTGPNLDGIVGRRVGADPNFAYSPAFRKFAQGNRRWTRDLLERYLADPATVAPGSTMGFFGLKRAEDRAALIRYLAAER